MAQIDVDIDIDDYLDEASDRAIEEEYRARQARKARAKGEDDRDYRMTGGEISMTLDHASLKLRQLGEIALASRLDEIRADRY